MTQILNKKSYINFIINTLLNKIIRINILKYSFSQHNVADVTEIYLTHIAKLFFHHFIGLNKICLLRRHQASLHIFM